MYIALRMHMMMMTVARILVEEYVCDKGFPKKLHSDQGPQFESRLIKDLCTIIEIVKTSVQWGDRKI